MSTSQKNGNAADYFVDRHVREGRGEKIAFIEHGGRTLTYGDLAAQSDCMADFYARHGIAREDRVAMLVLDTLEFPVIFWGSLKAGVIPTCMNTLLATDVYRAMLQDSRAKVLFVSAPLYPVIESLLESSPYLSTVFVIGGEPPAGTLSFANEFAKCGPQPMLDCSADECAFWLYSSGSTGKPKGVRHVHSSLRETADTYGAQVLGIAESDTIFSAAKLFFAYGLGNGMTFPMSVGATAILMAGRPTPDSVIEVLETHSPTIFGGVPTLYAALVAELKKRGKLDCDLRRCISAGEALPEEIGKRWEEITGTEILDGVGSTEMLHIFLSNAPGDVEYGTSGTAVPGYEVRLVDDSGSAVKQGEVGEMLVRGGSAAADYWNQRAKSRDTFEGNWTRTGDKYEQRADGRYIYCGRTDDMFKVSGIWVSPFEVEQAIVSHPAVLEAAVVAARDEEDLEKPKAFIVLNEGESADGFDEAIKEHVKDKIGKWKYPRWVEFRDELPKTATGKIQRFKLRDPV